MKEGAFRLARWGEAIPGKRSRTEKWAEAHSSHVSRETGKGREDNAEKGRPGARWTKGGSGLRSGGFFLLELFK